MVGFAVPLKASNFNKQINYQGKLTNTSNVAVANGSYHMFFRLWDDDTGGNRVWFEDRSAQTGDLITVTSGLFSVLLGSSTPMTSVDFDQTLYLEIDVCGTASSTCETLSPRKKLGAVPAAFEADNLDGKDESEFGTLGENETVTGRWSFSSSTSNTLLTVTQSGTGNLLDLIGGSNTNFTVLRNGNVGIGTSTPNWNLQVASSTKTRFALSDMSAAENKKHWLFSSQGGDLVFATSTDSYATTTLNALTILSNGNVGVATNTPYTNFSVTGKAYMDYASTTAMSGTTVCIGTDCRTVWPTSDTGYDNDFSWQTTYNTLSAATTSALWIRNKIYASSTIITNNASSTLTDIGTVLSGTWNGTAIGDSFLTKSGDWTGTIDGNNFAGGAIGAGA